MSSKSKKRKLGVEMPLEPVPSEGIRKDNPRLQKHLRHFQESKKDLINIIRLKLMKNKLNRKAFERHATHVAAWVALLPVEAATDTSGISGISPVTLLSRLLAKRGKGPMTDWLRGALGLVRERIESDGLKYGDWLQLKQSLPRATKRRYHKLRSGTVETNVSLFSCTDSDTPSIDVVGAEQALKSFADAQVAWHNIVCLSEQKDYIDSLEDFLKRCLAKKDIAGLREVACKLAAALMPPRAQLNFNSQDARPLDAAAQDRLQAAHQTKLRNLILTCLSHLELTNEQCQPALQYISGLIEQFIGRCGCLKNACASKQWISLRKKIDRNLIANVMEDRLLGQEKGAETGSCEVASRKQSASVGKYTVIGLGVEWSTDLDRQMLELVKDGVSWESMEEQLHRSARWLKMRCKQLEKDPSAPCPTGNRDSSSSARVGHRNLARLALERMPEGSGTVKQICAEILKLDVPEISSLDRNIMPGPTRTSNEERWMARIADEVSKSPEFVMIGKRGLQGIWQLRIVS